MSFPIAISTELLKTKRSASFWLSIVGAAFIPGIFFLAFVFNPSETMPEMKATPWRTFFGFGWNFLSAFLFPMFVILVCTLIPQIEYKNNTWKQVLASPQTKFNIYFSKFLIIQLLILLFLVMHNLYMILSVMGVHHLRNDIAIYDHGMNWNWFFTFNGNLYLSVLGLSAIQFWLGVRFRNFIVPLAIGFGLLMIGILLVGAYNWPYGDKYPFAFSLMLYISKFKDYTFLIWSSLT